MFCTSQCIQPEYHMYHMHIELRWYFISLMYAKNIYCQYSIENHLDEFENMQTMIINDLIYISLKIFETVKILYFHKNIVIKYLDVSLRPVFSLQYILDAFDTCTTKNSI